MRAFAEGQRRKMAATAVARRRISIALACRTFGVSETCYRYSPQLKDENEQIADLAYEPPEGLIGSGGALAE